MEEFQKPMPAGSNAFAMVMADIHKTPIVEITSADDTDNNNGRRSSHSRHHEEGRIVHGLHHCYKVEGGHCLTSFRCNHDHHRLSSGHLEEMAPSAQPASPKRRMSVAATAGGGLHPEDTFRLRALSDASSKRRGSMPVNQHIPPGGSPRRGSVDKRSETDGSSPQSKSPNRQRRGSNAILHSDELHYVYDQYLQNKK